MKVNNHKAEDGQEISRDLASTMTTFDVPHFCSLSERTIPGSGTYIPNFAEVNVALSIVRCPLSAVSQVLMIHRSQDFPN